MRRLDSNRPDTGIATRWAVALAVILMAGTPSCVSKTKARRETVAAVLRAQAPPPMTPEQARNTLFVRGQVRNAVIPWHPGMILSQALVEADYMGRQDPRTLIVTRNGVIRVVDVKRLLRGLDDHEVLPGDQIEVR